MFEEIERVPAWVMEELRRPVMANAARQARIMELVRRRPAHARFRRAPHPPARRGLVSSITGLALAAGFAGIVAVSGLLHPLGRPEVSTEAGHARVIGDSITSALHDTLRLVQFVLRAPAASRVTLVGDFNAWSRTATPLARDNSADAWSATVALRRGRYHYAFVVDDTRWVPGAGVRGHEAAVTARATLIVGGDTT
jgi:hypothetical protein